MLPLTFFSALLSQVLPRDVVVGAGAARVREQGGGMSLPLVHPHRCQESRAAAFEGKASHPHWRSLGGLELLPGVVCTGTGQESKVPAGEGRRRGVNPWLLFGNLPLGPELPLLLSTQGGESVQCEAPTCDLYMVVPLQLKICLNHVGILCKSNLSQKGLFLALS